MLTPPGGTGIVDVRDVGELLARAVAPGHGPKRYLTGGHYLSWVEWTELLGQAAGVDVLRQDVSAEQMVDLGRHFDEQRRLGQEVDVPLSEEVAQIMTSWVPTDDSGTLSDLGMAYRPLLETFRDTVDYLRSLGRVLPPGPAPRS